MRIYLGSIGCRLNQSEVDMIARDLLAIGHEVVSDPEAADKAIINTCAVTREAAKDSRKIARRLTRQNPAAELILTGCYATIAPAEQVNPHGVGRIVKNADKDRLLQIIDPSAPKDIHRYEIEPILRDYLTRNGSNTRAFVKVQDGCANRCTFCITTIARGRSTSRPVAEVVQEINALSAAGYKEAVLTGVHLGSYGKDLPAKTDLRELVRNILAGTDIQRLRLSSLEPWDIPEGFFELWDNPRLQSHLHLPLQSGCDETLRRMARRTSKSQFRSIVVDARKMIPQLALSTDIIVGFPGESDKDFQESMEYVSEIGFSRLHVFPYSKRPGTAAAQMEGQLPKSTRKERARMMIALGEEMSLAFHKSNEGQTKSVLWERVDAADEAGLRWVGYTENYIRIRAYGPPDMFNRIVPTAVSEADSRGMTGIMLPENPSKH